MRGGNLLFFLIISFFIELNSETKNLENVKEDTLKLENTNNLQDKKGDKTSVALSIINEKDNVEEKLEKIVKILQKHEKGLEEVKENSKKEKDKKEKDKKAKKKEEKPPKKLPIIYIAQDSEFRLYSKFRTEFFGGKNLRLLNDRNDEDRLAYFRHILDLNAEYHYGKASRKYDVVIFKLNLRNRGIWGDPESIALTTESEVKRLDVISGSHRHAIPRHFLWIRELWMQVALNDALCLGFDNIHTFTFGAFPFELGRGIALGSAYGVGPDLLGYYAEAAIDQYAFGFKFSGEIFKESLSYDVYGAILDNKASMWDYTIAPIKRQQYGHFFTPTRGFGIINYLVAGRLRWVPPVCRKENKILLEPYVVFNDQREQRIEFVGDANSKLITPGFAMEFEFNRWDFGFDTAFNFGRQKVKGWDRNNLIEQNRRGFEVIVNSRVKQIDPITGKSDLALAVPENEKIIKSSVPKNRCETDFEVNNGEIIGSNKLGTLINDDLRFRDPYTVHYRGSMFVCDVGFYLFKPEVKINATVGFASGDDNPHKDLEEIPNPANDIDYHGFISLLEVYSGVRVKSAFLLSGSGRIPRILSIPSEEVSDPYPSAVSRFTNLFFTGYGVNFKFPKTYRKWNINPNVLWYWQEFPTLLSKTEKSGQKKRKAANKFLGIEINTFAEIEILDDFRFFAVGALFLPGKHYKEIKGFPLNKEQKRYLDSLKEIPSNAQELIVDRAPLLGDDKSWFINVGLEYKF